ncbi:MAG: type II toxin-antitoxin system VapC family toxin [Candidatus Hydrogenedentes bacterium]|nr:type II toxin-antitoxin system VapC family toxin [Candidatus Hydrogenedentota bacterium]
MLLDSNIVIYAFDPAHAKVADFLRGKNIRASAVSKIEVMGYWRLTNDDHQSFAAFFAELDIIALSPEIVDGAIALRRKRSIGLADAIIAATALAHNLPLATHNTHDFDWIEGLDLIDPVEG